MLKEAIKSANRDDQSVQSVSLQQRGGLILSCDPSALTASHMSAPSKVTKHQSHNRQTVTSVCYFMKRNTGREDKVTSMIFLILCVCILLRVRDPGDWREWGYSVYATLLSLVFYYLLLLQLLHVSVVRPFSGRNNGSGVSRANPSKYISG
jgi:hypothetical protein